MMRETGSAMATRTTGRQGPPERDAADTIEMIRDRLSEQAFLFEDRGAYQSGVEDALDEVEINLLDEDGQDPVA